MRPFPPLVGKNVSVILTLSTARECQVFLDELNAREQKPKVLTLPPLEKDEIRSFLDQKQYPSPYLPLEELLTKEDAGNPLYLNLLCLELLSTSSK